MSLNATTPSGLNPYAAGDEAKLGQVLFDATSTSIYSKVFTVNQEPGLLKITGHSYSI